MKVSEKIYLGKDGLIANGAINIVIFGDSVSHGCFDAYDVDAQAVYWHQLEIMLHKVNNYMPINMINSAIGATTASGSLNRIKRDILSYHPDLVIVSYGLNDVNGSLEEYRNALRKIYTESINCGAQVIHMTQNMLNTYVSDEITEEYVEYASKTAEMQKNGLMDTFVNAAIETAKECGAEVCDCYAEWKKMYENGVDTTALLTNHINHPSKEMHKLFAEKLYNTIMGVNNGKVEQAVDAMYHE